jgi:AcrR family transcriptional regulator
MTIAKRRRGRTGSGEQDRRQALIEAAYTAIASKGFEGLRLRAVATAAGIDHSTLHHYFRAKRDLIAAVVDYATQQFRPPSGVPAPTTLAQHLEMLGRMIVDRRTLHAVLRELDLRATRDAKMRAIVVKQEAGWRLALTARLRAAAETGAWPAELDPALGAELVIALVKGASLNPTKAIDVLHLFQALLRRPSKPASKRR